MLKPLTQYLKPRTMILLHLYNNRNFQDYPARIAKELDMSPMTVSRHLSKLDKEGVIEVIGIHRRKLYDLSEKGVLEVENFLELLDKFYKSLEK